MNHGLSQVFRAGLASRLAKRALVRDPVILENQWMIHGNIRRPLLKITYRIAASGHHVAQQLVGVGYGASRAVNEPRLDSAPSLHKTGMIPRRERPDVQSLDSVRTLVERRFCLPTAPAFF